MLRKDILCFLSLSFSLKKLGKEMNFDRYQDFMFIHHNRIINYPRYQMIKNSL